MKKIIILLFFTFFIYNETLIAQEFNMKILRISERKLALNEFKKLHKNRQNYKQQLYQKAKHKRSKKIKKSSILNTEKIHIMDKSLTDVHSLHNMTDSHMQTDTNVDMMNHQTQEDIYMNNMDNDIGISMPNSDVSNEGSTQDIVSKPDSDSSNEEDTHSDIDQIVNDTYENEINAKVRKRISPWKRKR